MSVDLTVMAEVARGLYMTMVLQEHGPAGVTALRTILASLLEIYRYLEPESCDTVVVFKRISDSVAPPKGASLVRTYSSLRASGAGKRVLLELKENGEMFLWRDPSAQPHSLAAGAVVYEYNDRVERFYAKDKVETVPKLVSSHASMFAIPHFSDLRSALEHYHTNVASKCSCDTLETCWAENNRIFLRVRPEATMRGSLTRFLKSTLRNAEVRPEQIVDESHPVDIKVTWLFAARLALIEIKWLGQSITDKGKLAKRFTQVRVQEGARQLADYLDANEKQAADRVTRGYLVVFDARRRKLTMNTKTIGEKDGMWYKDKDVPLKDNAIASRGDFEHPYRFFLAPRIG